MAPERSGEWGEQEDECDGKCEERSWVCAVC